MKESFIFYFQRSPVFSFFFYFPPTDAAARAAAPGEEHIFLYFHRRTNAEEYQPLYFITTFRTCSFFFSYPIQSILHPFSLFFFSSTLLFFNDAFINCFLREFLFPSYPIFLFVHTVRRYFPIPPRMFSSICTLYCTVLQWLIYVLSRTHNNNLIKQQIYGASPHLLFYYFLSKYL